MAALLSTTHEQRVKFYFQNTSSQFNSIFTTQYNGTVHIHYNKSIFLGNMLTDFACNAFEMFFFSHLKYVIRSAN